MSRGFGQLFVSFRFLRVRSIRRFVRVGFVGPFDAPRRGFHVHLFPPVPARSRFVVRISSCPHPCDGSHQDGHPRASSHGGDTHHTCARRLRSPPSPLSQTLPRVVPIPLEAAGEGPQEGGCSIPSPPPSWEVESQRVRFDGTRGGGVGVGCSCAKGRSETSPWALPFPMQEERDTRGKKGRGEMKGWTRHEKHVPSAKGKTCEVRVRPRPNATHPMPSLARGRGSPTTNPSMVECRGDQTRYDRDHTIHGEIHNPARVDIHHHRTNLDQVPPHTPLASHDAPHFPPARNRDVSSICAIFAVPHRSSCARVEALHTQQHKTRLLRMASSSHPLWPRRNLDGPTPPRTPGIALRGGKAHQSQRMQQTTQANAFAMDVFGHNIRKGPCPSRTTRPVGPRRGADSDPFRPFGSSQRDPGVDLDPQRMRYTAKSPPYVQ